MTARTKMLVAANLDGYAADDDATAIARFLSAMGDANKDVPDDIANWIVDRLGTLGDDATPRLIGAYMHFLRAAVKAPPFPAGNAGSARNRLLSAIARRLSSRATPLSSLALLMFKQIDDLQLRQLADAAEYKPLASFPWQVGCDAFCDDWFNWILVGLNPDAFTAAAFNSPDYPVVSAKAKAGLLPQVRQFLSTLDLRPPVSKSSMNFMNFSHLKPHDAGTWAHLRSDGGGVTLGDGTFAGDPASLQLSSLGLALSPRIAQVLNVPPISNSQIGGIAGNLALFSLPPNRLAIGIANAYLLSLPRPASEPPRKDFAALAGVVGDQQNRILALAAYGLVTYQRLHHGAAQDIAMSEVFGALQSLVLPGAEQKTVLVDSFSPSDLASADAPDLSALSACKPSQWKLQSRRASLRDHIFLESLTASCADHTSSQLTVSGVIPTDLVRLMELNKNYLDIIDQPFSVRHLDLAAAKNLDGPDDLDLVQSDPWKGLTWCLVALAHPDMPWRYTRDVLLSYYPRSLEWFFPGWRPRFVDEQSNPADFPYNGRTLLTPDEFAAQKQTMLHPEMLLLQTEARTHFLTVMGPVVNTMSDTEPCQSVPGGGLSCGNGPNPAKVNAIAKLNAIRNDNIRYGYGLSDPACLAPLVPAHKLDRLVSLVDQSSNNYLVQYNSDACRGVAQGSLSSDAASLLDRDLALDPLLLNRYQLDLLNSTADEATRAAGILGAVAFEDEYAPELLAKLRASGLIGYLPSITAPLTSAQFDPRELTLSLSLDSPILAATAPLLRTPAGIDLAVDIAALQKLQLSLPQAGSPQRATISDATIAKLRAVENQEIANVHQCVDAEIAPTIAAIQAQEQANWTFELLIGIAPGIVPGLSFTIDGFGLNATLNLPAVNLNPIIPPGITLPVTSFALPNPATPSEGPSQFSIPLAGFDTGSSTAQRAPAGSSPLLQADPPDPVTITWTLPEVEWDSLLSINNSIGRDWLNEEIKIATPLLSRAQLDSIAQGLQQPMFPTDLASLIAEKALAVEAAARFDPTTAPVEAACNQEVWSSCGIEVAKALDNTTDPQRAAALEVQWGMAFDKKYNALRQKGNLERAVPEAERISEVLKENFNPVDLVTDPDKEEMVEKYVPHLAPVWKWATGPVMVGLQAFFQPQDVGTDLDDLTMMNDAIQEKVADIIRPYLKPDWKERITSLVETSGPAWRAQPLPH